ncbi:hypothetical protein GUJ93_ZPchr0004g39748 [Zizania palustris]|uniref:Pectinesterase inhibitor domain-containing protein n=1 Tax=Zizania palustris TaxID=103762 RepID=A0A8J5SLN6_ZIZPA|nr:hypothetical protein GUJ93_ZPchr0004g39748 [Zizania palustris]
MASGALCSILFFLLVLTAGHANPAINKPQQQLVQSTCNSTTYYDLCVAALAADPSSSTSDVRGLCAIAVSAAAANASAAADSALSSATADQNQAPERAALLRACAAKYAEAREALGAAREAIKGESYDYAFVHVSAAAEYPAVCRALFRRRQRGAVYPPELARREEGLRRLCTVALDIISLLLTP